MPLAEIDGQDLFYFEHPVGDLQIPPLLLIHGAGGQHSHWPPQVRRMQGVRTIAPDLPGHGKSGGEGYGTIKAYAENLLRLVDALGLDRFIPVGHSMGGAVAQHIALTDRARVAGVGLISTGARLPVNRDLIEKCQTDYAWVVDFVMKYGFSPDADSDLRRLGRMVMQSISPVVTAGDYGACDAYDAVSMVHMISVPTVVVCGTLDKMTPPKFSQYLADRLPDAELHLAEGAGHMLPSEQPAYLADLLRGWLDRRFGAS
jgi:pimeloyl-ACP methyl ester carboxylesterase